MTTLPLWHVYRIDLQSVVTRENPFLDVATEVDFYSPSGRKQTVDAFWDGGLMWGARFAPDEYGEWRWVSRCDDREDFGLNGQTGYFVCEKHGQESELFRRGPVKVSSKGPWLCTSDETPFFWLADIAWNGVIRATEDDWGRYLANRRDKGFSVIEFVCTHWRGATTDNDGEVSFSGLLNISLNPAFFRKLDRKFAAVNEHGLVAAPVMIWARTDNDPGQTLSTSTAEKMLRYLQARYGAYQVVWLMGADGDYNGDKVEKWIQAGRTVFVDRPKRLVGLHCSAKTWISEKLRQEPWLGFVGYQSGHSDTDVDLRWLLEGPPSQNIHVSPVKPALNLEPNREGRSAGPEHRQFSAFDVRRVAYWSIFNGTPAGVSYGHGTLWFWATGIEKLLNHEHLATAEPWTVGLNTEGVESMSILRKFFESFRWWEFEPWMPLLRTQPGIENIADFVSVIASADRSVAIVYSPGNNSIFLVPALASAFTSAHWFDPRQGTWHDAAAEDTDRTAFCPPRNGDWLLVLGELT